MRFAIVLSCLFLGACSSRECQIPPLPRTPVAQFRCDLSGAAGDSIETSLDTCLTQRGNRGLKILALSGGGQKGAFGAGFLKGWTQSRTRPEFDVVTGISTGALISTLAFLGPEFDPVLEQLYTSVDNGDILRDRGLIRALFASSLATLDPLEDILETFITEEMMLRVAAEYEAGRRLFVGTVNLDTGNLVIWDMTSIAHRQREQGVDLYRRILRASASIPVQFEPVIINQEMHVDGGVREQIFVSGITERICRVAQSRPGPPDSVANVFMIVNGKVVVDPECVPEHIISIGSRTLDILLNEGMLSSLQEIFSLTNTYDLQAGYVHIADDTVAEGEDDPFDPEVMDRLFQEGFEKGQRSNPWITTPPIAVEIR